MNVFVVQFHDAYGHRDVRKVCRSYDGARDYIVTTLNASSARDVSWQCDTLCTAMARFRGRQEGFEPVAYTIDSYELAD